MPNSITFRRQLLRRSDALLEHVEQLRLSEQDQLPEALKIAIARIAEDVRGRPMQTLPTTIAGAHSFLLNLQVRLVRAPVQPRRRPLETASATPAQGPELWKELELPSGERDADWWPLAELMVQRALDRFSLVRGQATAEARRGRRAEAGRLWRKVEAAWANYWRLADELSQLRP